MFSSLACCLNLGPTRNGMLSIEQENWNLLQILLLPYVICFNLLWVLSKESVKLDGESPCYIIYAG